MKIANSQTKLLQLILKHRDAFEASVERRMSTSTYNKLGHQFVLETLPTKGEKVSREFIGHVFDYDYLKPLDSVIVCMCDGSISFEEKSEMLELLNIIRFGELL